MLEEFKCPSCNTVMGVRQGRYGVFYYCKKDSKHRCISVASTLGKAVWQNNNEYFQKHPYTPAPKKHADYNAKPVRLRHENSAEIEEMDYAQGFEDGDYQTFLGEIICVYLH